MFISSVKILLKRFLPFVLAGTFCLPMAPSFAKTGGESARLAKLAETYFESRLKLFSLWATEDVGDPRYEGDLQIEIAPAHRVAQAVLFNTTLKTLNAIPPQSLTTAERLTVDVLQYDASMRLEALSYPRHLLPINQIDTVPVKLAQWAGGQSVQPFKTVRNYENYLKRIERLPLWVDQAIANMREGLRLGVTQPRAIIERSMPQLQALAPATLEDSAFYSPIARLPATFSNADKARLTSRYRKILAERVLPSQARLIAFMKDEYLPGSRSSAGLGALPGGDAWYRFQVRESITTTLPTEAIHAMGLQEVARIRSEMEGVKTRVGYSGELTDFLKGLEARPELTPFKTEQEVLARFEALNVRIKPQLKLLFGRAPKAALEIRPVDKLVRDSASSHYILPAVDGSRPGVFYAVVQDPLKFTTPSMTSLFLHEGQPGHHFQMALQQELDLPRFRRFTVYDAYGEGWALYAESLGRELGVYDDPFTCLGRLQAELLRAVRLVVDTGLHAKGWSREQTIQYMIETEGSTEANARRATERYMVWPGQALAYKIGELKILELRKRAQKTLGDRFDIRAFHDEVLGHGSLPLSMLETQVNDWVAQAVQVSPSKQTASTNVEKPHPRGWQFGRAL